MKAIAGIHGEAVGGDLELDAAGQQKEDLLAGMGDEQDRLLGADRKLELESVEMLPGEITAEAFVAIAVVPATRSGRRTNR